MTDRNTSTAGSRSVLSRFIMGCAAVIFTAYAFLVIRNQVVYGFEFIGATMGAGVTFLGGFCWLFAFDGRGRQNSRRFHLALLSGCVVGTFGFIGFFRTYVVFSEFKYGSFNRNICYGSPRFCRRINRWIALLFGRSKIQRLAKEVEEAQHRCPING